METIDKSKETQVKWTKALVTTLNAAGFGCHFETTNGMRMGRLIVRKNDNTRDIRYHIALERKSKIVDGNRHIFCGVEAYSPSAARHVHVTVFSPENVQKVVDWAMATIVTKTKQQEEVDDKYRREREGLQKYRADMGDYSLPDWMRTRPNTQSDADIGTYRVLFSDHLHDWPLARLSVEQVKYVAESLKAIVDPSMGSLVTADMNMINLVTAAKNMLDTIHKATSNGLFMSPGMKEHRDMINAAADLLSKALHNKPDHGWRPATVPVPPELVSDPNSPEPFKPMLVATKDWGVQRGYFLGGLINEFRTQSSNDTAKVTHWMPLPVVPAL